MAKLRELREELGKVFGGKGLNLLDAALPLVLFLAANQYFDLDAALAAALAAGLVLLAIRLLRRHQPAYALAGLGGVGLAAAAAYLSGSGSAFFYPGLLSGAVTVLICLGSAALRRPAASWASHLTRRWPLEWYWLDAVRPAYTEVSLIWAAAFGARTGLEYLLLQQGALNTLGAVRLLLGWPYTVLILVLSYLYGTWRLRNLQGPSVEEFLAGQPAPWQGQRKGF